ncbi:MAG: endonuclease domain-containing protein [Hyphomicrobiales bacterium]
MRDNAKLSAARLLRRSDTLAEKRLWEQLRNRQLEGFKFVRQAPVGPYIADFLCREHRLVVEVDGATHSSGAEMERDFNRTSHLAKLGYRVIRFQNDEIVTGMDQVLTLILEALTPHA